MRKKLITAIMCVLLMASQFAFALEAEVVSLTSREPEVKSDVKDGLNQPYGISVDKEGNLYVADTYNNMIKKISPLGIEIVAGSYTGKNSMGFPKGGLKDGPALESKFKRPRDVFATEQGELIVADTENHVIRKIADGRVVTIAGTGVAGRADGTAEKAQFNMPSAVWQTTDGNLYVADTLNNRICKIDGSGITQTLVFRPDGITLQTAALNEPSDILMTASGVLYILDSGNQAIKRVQNGVISLVAGYTGINDSNGYGETGLVDARKGEARFNFPKGFVMDNKGNIFVSDSWNHVIRVITADGAVETYAGSLFSGNTVGTLESARFNTPTGIAIRNGKLIVSDMWNNEVKEIDIDYSDAVFSGSEKSLESLIDPQRTTEAWSFWKDGNLLILSRPIIEENGVVYLPFRAVMEAHEYGVQWQESSRSVFYESADSQGMIDERSGMRLFNDNSYLSVEGVEKILNIDLHLLDSHHAIIEME